MKKKQDLAFQVTINNHQFVTGNIELAIISSVEPKALNRQSRRALKSYTRKLLKGGK